MAKYITGDVSYIAAEKLTVKVESFTCSIVINKETAAELIDNINKTMTGEIIEDKALYFNEVSIFIVPDVYPDRSTWQFVNEDEPGVRGVIFAEDIVRLKKELLKY